MRKRRSVTTAVTEIRGAAVPQRRGTVYRALAVIGVSRKVSCRVNGSKRGGGEGISLRAQKVHVFEPEKTLEIVGLELVVKGLMARDNPREAGKGDFRRFSSSLRSWILC